VLKTFKDSGSNAVPRKQRNVTKSSVLGHMLGEMSLMTCGVYEGGGGTGRFETTFSLSL